MPQHIEENLWNSCGLYWQSFGKGVSKLSPTLAVN